MPRAGSEEKYVGQMIFQAAFTLGKYFLCLSRVWWHISIALHWLGNYCFCSPQSWVTEQFPQMNVSRKFKPEAQIMSEIMLNVPDSKWSTV